MLRRVPLTRSKPLVRASFSRPPAGPLDDEEKPLKIKGESRVRNSGRGSNWPARAQRKPRPGHAPAYLAACRGESCFLNLPGCRQIPEDDTVVPAHRNQGKGMGLKTDDRLSVPACHRCHTLYDQSGLDREYKRAAWDWAFTRWEPARAAKMQKDEISTKHQADTQTRKKDGIPAPTHQQTGVASITPGHP